MTSGKGRNGKGFFVVISEIWLGGEVRTEEKGLVRSKKGDTGTHHTGRKTEILEIYIIWNKIRTRKGDRGEHRHRVTGKVICFMVYKSFRFCFCVVTTIFNFLYTLSLSLGIFSILHLFYLLIYFLIWTFENQFPISCKGFIFRTLISYYLIFN